MDINKLSLKYNREIKKDADNKRAFNIKAFAELSREGLEFKNIERKLYLYDTSSAERIWIQYPGKETLTGKPWDFRPKLLLQNGTSFPDLAFPDIWDDLSDIHTNKPESLEALAAILFRMAYMVDYEKESQECHFEDVSINTGAVTNNGTIIIEFYKPKFDQELLEELQLEIGSIRGTSLEAYLLYNDLLVQNEDCKYYYRDTIEKGTKWNSSIGRKNTLLTHLSVIEYIQGRVKFSAIMNRFQRGRGVAPITLNAIPVVTGDIIEMT